MSQQPQNYSTLAPLPKPSKRRVETTEVTTTTTTTESTSNCKFGECVNDDADTKRLLATLQHDKAEGLFKRLCVP